MIDTHLHILPGIDDGSRDFEESIAMAKKLVELGFRIVISSRIIKPRRVCVKNYKHN